MRHCKSYCSLEPKALRFSRMIGTGGIGSGLFFKLEGNHTLGRNESRMGSLVPYKDYCKLHIISHYVAVLLGAGSDNGFEVHAIGKVGNDDIGRRMIYEMANAGIHTDHVDTLEGYATLFSVCFQYPDSTGGNITTSDSACSMLSMGDIDRFFDGFPVKSGSEIILAAPEVPLEPRIRMLEHGRTRGNFNAASITSSEAVDFIESGGINKVDYLAVNIDEARAIAGIPDGSCDSGVIVSECLNRLGKINPGLMLTVTDGPNGCYAFDGKRLEYIHSLKTEAAGTGGAGDAFLAGVLTGLACGLPFLKGRDDESFAGTPIASAVEFGTLLASLSVTSPDTIHQEADARLLYEYVQSKRVGLSETVLRLFR
jgi:sugar/nucleoside kinase (ribokinase family)